MAKSEYIEALNRGIVAARTARDDRLHRQLARELAHLVGRSYEVPHDGESSDGDHQSASEQPSGLVSRTLPGTTIHPPSWLRKKA